MKLYIFRCRTRPKMYGATRYETASNLPASKCSAGWEFWERIDLTPRGRLRYAVDTNTVRRMVETRGWHMWDESRSGEAEIFMPVPQEQETAAEPEAVDSNPPEYAEEEFPETMPVLHEESHSATERELAVSEEEPKPIEQRRETAQKEAAESVPLPREPQREPQRPEAKRETAELEKWAETSRKKSFESAPLPREPRRPVVERETDRPEEWADTPRKKVTESAPLPHQPQRPAVHRGTGGLDEWSETSRRKVAESRPLPPREAPHAAVGQRTHVQEERQQYPTRKEAETRPVTGEPRRSAEPATRPPMTASAPARKIASGPPAQVSPLRSTPVVNPDKVEIPPTVPKPLARHQVTWFDIPVRDIDRAVRFYSAVLAVPLKKQQAGPGAAIAVLPHEEESIGGSLVQNMDARPSESGPLLYLNTNGRLDEALNEVVKHGGKVLAERHSIEPFGFRAIVLDTEGNRIALHSR